jgi:steroid 5-alpha reductase family enzyme
MTVPQLSLLTVPPTLAVFLVAWVVSVVRRDTGVADVFWGLGFIAAAVAALMVAEQPLSPRGLLVLALTLIWGVRLAAHIALRNRGRGEDPRYAAWRQDHGASWPLRSLFTVFLFQGALCWVISIPVQASVSGSGPSFPSITDVVGSVLWLAGFTWEAVADWQLLRFRGNPANRGRILTTGLWSRSRHPNYFGEMVLWWGFYLIALGVPGGWLTFPGPMLLTILLLRVSGVPMTERLMASRPGWSDYARRTPAFWPRVGPVARPPDVGES